MIDETPKEAVCADCGCLFVMKTGAIVPEWAHVRHVSVGPLLCSGCKNALIDTLERAVPVFPGG